MERIKNEDIDKQHERPIPEGVENALFTRYSLPENLYRVCSISLLPIYMSVSVCVKHVSHIKQVPRNLKKCPRDCMFDKSSISSRQCIE